MEESHTRDMVWAPATTKEADVTSDTDKLWVPYQMKVGDNRETLNTSIMSQRGVMHSKNLAELRLKNRNQDTRLLLG